MFIYKTVNYFLLEVNSIFFSRFGSLISITPQVLKYCDTVDSILDYIEIPFADQNGRPLEIDDDINCDNNKKSIYLNYKT